jgi:translation initiation factor IF-2
MHRVLVEQWTRRAQVAGGVLLVGAAGLAVAPGSWAGPRGAEAEVVAAGVPGGVAGAGGAVVAVKPVVVPDALELGTRWAVLSPDMPKDDPPAPAAGELSAAGEPVPPPPPPPPPWRYLGSIVGPRWALAIVSVNDQQRLVRVGESIDEHTVVLRVEPKQLVVSERGVERAQEIAPRQEQPEGQASPMGGGGVVGGGGMGEVPVGGGREGAAGERIPSRARPGMPGGGRPGPGGAGAGEGGPKPANPLQRWAPPAGTTSAVQPPLHKSITPEQRPGLPVKATPMPQGTE